MSKSHQTMLSKNIAIIGSGNSGKTAFFTTLTGNNAVRIPNKNIDSFTEEFEYINDKYYVFDVDNDTVEASTIIREANVIYALFSVKNIDSFNSINSWLYELFFSGEDVPEWAERKQIIICATMVDTPNRVVMPMVTKAVKKTYYDTLPNVRYVEVSAFTGYNMNILPNYKNCVYLDEDPDDAWE